MRQVPAAKALVVGLALLGSMAFGAPQSCFELAGWKICVSDDNPVVGAILQSIEPDAPPVKIRSYSLTPANQYIDGNERERGQLNFHGHCSSLKPGQLRYSFSSISWPQNEKIWFDSVQNAARWSAVPQYGQVEVDEMQVGMWRFADRIAVTSHFEFAGTFEKRTVDMGPGKDFDQVLKVFEDLCR